MYVKILHRATLYVSMIYLIGYASLQVSFKTLHFLPPKIH